MSPVFFSLLASSAIHGAWPTPTPAELAMAIARFTGKRVIAPDVRRVSCKGFEEEPTEAVCTWQQRRGHRWLRRSTYVALDRSGWQLIDEPAQPR